MSDKKPFVLVVDDNRDAADSLAELLALGGGHEVRAVYSGAAAIEAVSASPPEVVFLDLGMPEMDGFETASRLRSMPGGRNLVLIALTGYGDDESRQQTVGAGFDVHLIKPADPQVALSAIANARQDAR